MEIVFNNGKKCPVFGLGTWQSPKEETKQAVKAALEAGYKHIDTAYNYLNEDAVGEAVKEFLDTNTKKIKRKDLFITTKLPYILAQPDRVSEALDIILKNLQMDYVDLYLVHLPIAMKFRGDYNDVFPIENGKWVTDDTDLEGVWKAMEVMVEDGKAKSIGVSNFNSKQVERICNIAMHKPVTNQVECHGYLPQKELADFCRKWKIVLTAYSPLGSPGRPAMIDGAPGLVLLDDPVVKEISAKYKKTPAQILLRWLLQRNFIVIPKSITPARIKENIQVFDFTISDADMTKLGNLPTRKRLISFKGCEHHPEFPFAIDF